MIPADVLTELATLGLSRDQAESVALMLARVEQATKSEVNNEIEAVRAPSSAAERQARYRARKNAREAAARDVTGDGVTSRYVTGVTNVTGDVTNVTNASGTDLAHACGNPDPSLRSGSIVTPLPSVGPQAEKPKRVSGSALPQDWTPPEDLFAYGATLGLSRDQSAEILERMRLWAVGNKNRAVARKADWTSTMQGALRRDAAKFQARAGPARADPRDGLATVFRETLARVRDDERRQNETCGDGDVRSLPVVSAQPRADGFDVGGLLGGLKRFP